MIFTCMAATRYARFKAVYSTQVTRLHVLSCRSRLRMFRTDGTSATGDLEETVLHTKSHDMSCRWTLKGDSGGIFYFPSASTVSLSISGQTSFDTVPDQVKLSDNCNPVSLVNAE